MQLNFDSELLATLNGSEHSVYKYCVQNGFKVIDMSIQELADATYVSKTTVVRMCQKLGFDGFTEFRYYLKTLLEQKKEKEKMVDGKIHEMRKFDYLNTYDMINREKIEGIAHEIKDKHIHFFGKGLSNLVCEYAKIQLSLLDLHVTSFENSHLARTLGKKMTKNDVLFIISASGETPQCIAVANIVKNTDAKIISITEPGINTLSQLADVSLFAVMSNDDRVDFDNKSRVPFFIIMEYLVDALVEA